MQTRLGRGGESWPDLSRRALGSPPRFWDRFSPVWFSGITGKLQNPQPILKQDKIFHCSIQAPLVPSALPGRAGKAQEFCSGLWHREGKVGSLFLNSAPSSPASLPCSLLAQEHPQSSSDPAWAPTLHKDAAAGLVPRVWPQLGMSQLSADKAEQKTKPSKLTPA